ncbi:MAG: glycosyltransferase family 2 protein [Candidatus Nanoarchaeia archaeon]|nr:glycosyltransferase family 2 protein [Candidatus Nanoarchaeia archaeon]MDD5239263.1 glycosyltransferase family 2 protein [Candidatus Nanoarchaeia archaeon]
MKTIAVIPAYNEERHIKSVLERTRKYVDKIIVVDDGSTDNTARIARKVPGIEIIQSKENRGKADAVSIGIKKAFQYKPDTIILMDSDGQHLPEEIPLLLEHIKKDNAVFVSGERAHTKKPLLRAFAGIVVDFLVGGKDILCGFKAIKADALKKFDLEGSKNYLIEIALHDEARRNKVRIDYVPISTVYSKHIKSKIDYKREFLSYIAYRFNKLKRSIKQ